MKTIMRTNIYLPIMKRIAITIAAGSLLAAFASAQPTRVSNQNLLTYVLTNNPQTGAAKFGAVDMGSGAFLEIGPGLPADLGHGLMPAPGSSLLSLAVSGDLYSIDLRMGLASKVGATGLGDCSTPASPCGPNSAVTLGYVGGKYYALDFSQNLYSVDPVTGATKLIGPTGIPAITIVPGSIDPATGKLNLYFESLFSFRGKLYANFDTSQFDFSNGSLTAVIPAALYEIDPATGVAHMIAPTDVGLLTIVNVNETIYAFDAAHRRFVALDLKTGQTEPVSNIDPSAGLVCGATPARPMPSDRP